MPQVTVIVPIYKVEAFIERCAKSLMEQTLRDVEYIFVNDATPDDSIEVLRSVLAKYPERNVRILEHKQNKGLPAARNTGLSVATGEYVFHCDSDDYVEADMLETLYNVAVEKNADIVWCDWFLSFEQNERYMKQPEFATALEALKAMLGGGMKFNVWNKLVKRSLYIDNNISFPAGYGMGEDMTMMMLFAHAQEVAYVSKAFYHYVKTNNDAFSRTYSSKHIEELKYNVNRIASFITSKYGSKLELEVSFLKLEAKFPFLLSGDDEKMRLWSQWYPEANKYILKNKYISFRSRMIQWFAWKKQFWIIRIYSLILNKIIYGVVFK